jgi:hypothetical protein
MAARCKLFGDITESVVAYVTASEEGSAPASAPEVVGWPVVFRFVVAEACEPGACYYGIVTAKTVLQHLENAAEVGPIRLRQTGERPIPSWE